MTTGFVRLAIISLLSTPLLFSAEPAPGTPGTPTGPAEGHSEHGAAFDEGPRQAARTISGTGRIAFPITTKNAEAQQYFLQGVGQLHGFWYYEAERSFRQAARLDPDCAMTYWGMAMANLNNATRAQGFIAEAIKRREKTDAREKLWIDAFSRYMKADDKRPNDQKRRDYVRDLEKIVQDFPQDIEAKAFLVFQIWDNSEKSKLPISSHQAVDTLLDVIFAANPDHPAHHYRIHLWDKENAARALQSAAKCGQSAPGIAHMWHMPGHIFSKLNRHADAVWQQDAALRADLAYTMRDRILPDQIHNFAHNAEWFIRSLSQVGRAAEAIAVAKTLVELPRHPKHNALAVDGGKGGSGSATYARQRLAETLIRWEFWSDALSIAQGPYLEPTANADEQLRRLHLIALANANLRNTDAANVAAGEIRAFKSAQTVAKDDAVRKAEEKAKEPKKAEPSKEKPDAAKDEKKDDKKIEVKDEKKVEVKDEKKGEGKDEKKAEPAASDKKEPTPEEKIKKAKDDAAAPFDKRITRADNILNELEIYAALAKNDADGAKKLLEKAKEIGKERLVALWMRAGDLTKAEQLAREAEKDAKNQPFQLAVLCEVLHRAGKSEEARQRFTELRTIGGAMDLVVPIAQRLEPLRKEMNLPADWRQRLAAPDDVGTRPDLGTLGPRTWSPPNSTPFRLPAGDGKTIGLEDFCGRPVVVVFYLGHGCTHCIEQLNAFAPEAAKFRAAGIELIAIGTDSVENLAKTSARSKQDGGFPFPVLSNADLSVFKKYGCFDDFENKPLHGTFLVDADRRIRWWDVSYDPFTSAPFLLEEAKRLLSLQGGSAKIGAR